MRIYPGNHVIVADCEQTTQSTLQLGYFKEVEHDIVPVVKLEDNFCQKKDTRIYPYQQFKSNNFLFLDEDNNVVEGKELLRFSDGIYYYIPKDSIEFGPASFSYRILLQKSDSFKNNIEYNIGFKCLNDENGYASRLFSVFSSSNTDKPSNLFFNNNDSSLYSMLVGSEKEKKIDYILADYSDFTGTGKEFLEEKLAAHTNLWLVDESFEGALEPIFDDSIEITEDNLSQDTETLWTIKNYLGGSGDLRVWYNGTELERKKDFEEVYFDAEKKIVKISVGDIPTNLLLIYSRPDIKVGDVISYQIRRNREQYTLTRASIYKNDEYLFDGAEYVRFNRDSLDKTFPQTVYYYSDIFVDNAPIAILHKPNEGFIILSHPSLINHSEESFRLIFEIIAHTFFQSYFETESRRQFITDEPIDFYLKTNAQFNEYHPRINLNKILFEDGYNPQIEYSIEEVDARLNLDGNEDMVRYIGLDKFNNLLFRKTVKTDPVKAAGKISVFTVNDTVINYDKVQSVIHLVEEIPKISYEYENNQAAIIVAPLFSSSRRIDIRYTSRINKDDNGNSLTLNTDYYLYYDEVEKRFKLSKDSIDEDKNNGFIARINLSSKNSLSCGDIRQFGGGDTSSLNYEMIDSGSIKGRPYRVGSTMIIKLPKRFSAYKDILEKEIKKHMASGDYPILIFE